MSLIASAKYNVFRLQPIICDFDIVSCFGTDVMDESPDDEDREWKLPVSLNQFFSSLNNLNVAWTGFEAHDIEVFFSNSKGEEYVVEVAADPSEYETDYALLYLVTNGAKKSQSDSHPFAFFQDVPLTMEDFGQIFEVLAQGVVEMQSNLQIKTDNNYVVHAYDGLNR